MPNLSGFGFDDAGDAINAATVEVFARNTSTPAVTSTTTNASGYWERLAVAEGRYDIWVTNGSDVRKIMYDRREQYEELEVAQLFLRNPANTFAGEFVCPAITAARQWTLPLTAGTLALTTDITGTTRYKELVVVDFDTVGTTGNGKFYIHMQPDFNGMNLTYVHATHWTVGTSGGTTIQIHNITDAVDVLTTLLTIDSGELGSHTAAVAAVIDTAADDVATNDRWRVDIDAWDTGALGLTLSLGFQAP